VAQGDVGWRGRRYNLLESELYTGVSDVPRKIILKMKRSGRMIFDAQNVTSNLGIKEMMEIVFTNAESYKEIASVLLEWIKTKSDQENRGKARWVTTSELSGYIDERLMRRRRSATYSVIKNYLIPLGILEYRPSESKYLLSRDFAGALKRLAEAYTKWTA
jgi:hypothetical protein